MNGVRMFLLAVLALLAPTGLYATRLDVCNKGQVPVAYATAERQGSFLFGYKWVVEGWYLISPGHCDNVYHYRVGGGGGGDIHVAFAFTDSTGAWGAADFDITHDSGKVLRHSDRRFCATMKHFNYTQAGDDLGGPCAAGYFSFPAALYLEPDDPIACGTPYGFCSNYDFDFALTTEDRAIPVGPQGSKTSAPVKTPAQTAEPPKPAPEPAPAQVLGSILKALQDAADAARQQRAQAEQAGRQREAQEDDARSKRAEERIDALRGAAAQGNANAQLSVKLADEYKDSWKQLWASPQYAVSAYDPQWMGQNVVLRGTVASVQLDTSGFPVYMTVYFKESLDGTVTAYSPYSDLFRGKYGSDFSGLIGKVVEVAGHVGHFRKAKASINVLDPKQLRVAGNP